MSQGELREGDHYLQRVKHGRIVFVWSRMQAWMRNQRKTPIPIETDRERNADAVEPFYRVRHAHTHKER